MDLSARGGPGLKAGVTGAGRPRAPPGRGAVADGPGAKAAIATAQSAVAPMSPAAAGLIVRALRPPGISP
jgi:hypothetical protein